MNKIIDRPRFTCTLGGALGTLKALPGKVVPIMHAAPGCGGNLGYAISLSAAYAGSGYASNQAAPCTCVTEKDLIFGGEQRLEEQIKSTLEIMDGDLFVVMTACMVEVVGDDVRSVVSGFSDYERPVLAVETGGFRGNSYDGYDMLMETLVRDYVEPAQKKDSKTVNILGVVPVMDIFWKKDLTIIKNLLSEMGIKANTFFGEHETLDNLKYSAGAGMNLVLSDTYGLKTAECYKKQHDIPYMKMAFPIGDAATTEFLYQAGHALGIEENIIQGVVERHRGEYYRYMEKIVDLYTDCDFQRYAVVIGDANYAPAISRYLSDDIGWIPDMAVITDQLKEEEKDSVRERFKDYKSGVTPNVFFEMDTGKIEKHLRKLWPLEEGEEEYHDCFEPAFVIGSSLDREFARNIGAAHLSVSYPIANRAVINRGYAGFEGGLNMLEDIFTQLVAGR